MTVLHSHRAASKSDQQIKKVSSLFFIWVLPLTRHLKEDLPHSLPLLVIIIANDNNIQQSSSFFQTSKNYLQCHILLEWTTDKNSSIPVSQQVGKLES